MKNFIWIALPLSISTLALAAPAQKSAACQELEGTKLTETLKAFAHTACPTIKVPKGYEHIAEFWTTSKKKGFAKYSWNLNQDEWEAVRIDSNRITAFSADLAGQYTSAGTAIDLANAKDPRFQEFLVRIAACADGSVSEVVHSNVGGTFSKNPEAVLKSALAEEKAFQKNKSQLNSPCAEKMKTGKYPVTDAIYDLVISSGSEGSLPDPLRRKLKSAKVLMKSPPELAKFFAAADKH